MANFLYMEIQTGYQVQIWLNDVSSAHRNWKPSWNDITKLTQFWFINPDKWCAIGKDWSQSMNGLRRPAPSEISIREVIGDHSTGGNWDLEIYIRENQLMSGACLKIVETPLICLDRDTVMETANHRLKHSSSTPTGWSGRIYGHLQSLTSGRNEFRKQSWCTTVPLCSNT